MIPQYGVWKEQKNFHNDVAYHLRRVVGCFLKCWLGFDQGQARRESKVCEELKSITPRIRQAGQQSEGEKDKTYKRNNNGFFNSKPPPWQISTLIKIILVWLGARGNIPRKQCTWLINFLGLRGM